MKIIITEEQYKILENTSEEERVKKVLFKFWQKELEMNGEIEFDSGIAKYVNYNPDKIREMFFEFLGGWDKMTEKAYQLMGRTFDTMDYDFSGGYDFRFTVKGHRDFEEDGYMMVDCQIDSDGKVTLMMDNMETRYLKDLEEDEDLWWEVDSEIRSLIEDILYVEVTKKTGIIVDINLCWVE
jgi:hypothetical protein